MSMKNGSAESVLARAKREIEIRKKAQPDAKGGEAKSNPSNELNEIIDEQQPDEEVDPEVAAIMEKIKPVHDYKKKRNYSKIVVGYDSFLLTLDKKTIGYLDTKPSCLDGLTPEEEEDLRFLGVELIETIVHLLKLPMIVGETASIFFQRFYGLKSFVKHPFDHIVMACVLLATKIEETPRRPREIITVFDMLKQKYKQRENKSLKIDVLKIDVKYVMLKNNVVAAERRILCALGFVCQIKHPHGYIFVYLKTLKLIEDTEILNTAWAFMNDCMRTDLFLRYFPKTIAAACVVRVCRNSNPEVILPETDGFQWYEVYGVSSRDVEFIIKILDRMYLRTTSPDWTKLSDSVTEARRKKFGIEKVEDITEEEAKKSINAEEEESKKKQNGKDSTYAEKLNASPRKDVDNKLRRDDSKSKERYDSRKYNNDRFNRGSGRNDGRDDRNRRDDRSRKDRSEKDRKDRDRYGGGRRRSRSRSKERRGGDRDRTSHKDRSRQREVDKILKQRRRSRSRSPQRGRSQKV
uniref:Cyclin-like domain-containing protein n=1 Tax=Panagrolaimus sp. ES5 TaxID=591445 RepID=A0AC34GWL5_9BILA